MTRRTVSATAVALSLWALARVGAEQAGAWPDTFVSRLEALALMQTLNAEILASTSATLTLERWCADHRLADRPAIAARLMRDEARPPSAEQRRRLEVGDGDRVGVRHVELRCGNVVLSKADNWYVPERLSGEMNRLLETTETPFGKVVQALQPYRQTLGVTIRWSPLPDGWERGAKPSPASGTAALVIPDALFEHRAVLFTRDRVPFAEVDEVYQRGVLGSPPP